MWKYPSDISVTKNCIDANFEMAKRRNPDNIHCFPLQEWCTGTIPKIALNINVDITDIDILICDYVGKKFQFPCKLILQGLMKIQQ